MISDRQRHLVAQGCVVAAIVTAGIICLVSYFADRPNREQFASSNQVDLLQGNLTDHWSVFGALSSSEVSFKQVSANVVAVEIRAKIPTWSDVSSGVTHSIGLFDPGWYEFTGEFQAETNGSDGLGTQLEVHSGRWRFQQKADPNEHGWKKIDVYLRPSDSDPGAEIAFRFWATGGVRTGRVFFRNVRMVKIAGDPPQKVARFDLEKKEEARLGKPGKPRKGSIPLGRRTRLGRFRGAALTVVLLSMIVGICWRLLE